MKLRILCLLFFGAGVCKATPGLLNSEEQEAIAFARNASLKVHTLHSEMNDELLEYDISENDLKIHYLDVELATITQEINNAMKQFHDEKFTDPKLKYAFKKIRESGRELLLEGDIIDIMVVFRMALKMPKSDIGDIFTKSKDPEELKKYWIEWRNKKGAVIFEDLKYLVEKRKEAALINGITPLKFFLKEYNITEMENVMMQIEPLYIQLHGFIRNQLQKKYGDEVIKPNEPIPHHLFQQVLAQAWTSESIIDEMYPYKDLPAYDEIFKQKNYNPLEMHKTVDQFYKSLGLDSVPDEYWGSNFELYPSEDEQPGINSWRLSIAGISGHYHDYDESYEGCDTGIFDKSPNVYMRFCPKIDFNTFLQAHGYMSNIYFAREKVNLPSYYFMDSYGLQFPVGKAVILSASTPTHLENIGLLTESRFTQKLKMNRLLRMGIHTLLNVPVHFVHNKVMADFYSGSVNITEINKYYWKLMKKYVGTAPPVDPAPNRFDFPYKFYAELIYDDQPNKFMGEVLGYQFYEKLCEISGQYSKSNKSQPLNNCDFYGSNKVGDSLKKIMQLGSSKPMNEVLATIFPENQNVNAESLLEYYAPLKSWLIEINRKNNAIIGWEPMFTALYTLCEKIEQTTTEIIQTIGI